MVTQFQINLNQIGITIPKKSNLSFIGYFIVRENMEIIAVTVVNNCYQ